MSSILAGIAQGATEGLVNNTVGYYTQKNLNRQQRADYRKNLKLSQELNIEAQKRAIEQSTTALRNAGLSPVLAAQGGFSAPAASAPLGSSQAPQPHFDFSSAMLAQKEVEMQDVQKKNIESQTKVNEASAKKLTQEAAESEQRTTGYERENVRSTDYDKTMSESMKAAYRSYAQDSNRPQYERDFYESLANAPEDYTKGTLEAQRDFISYLNELDDFQKENVLRAVVRQVAKMQLDDKPTLEALAYAPKKEREKMIAEIADAWSSAKFRNWQRETLGPAQAELLGTEKNVKEHSDFVGMVEDGNYLGAGLMLLPSLLTGLGTAYMYGKVFKGASKASGVAAGAVDKAVSKAGSKAVSKDIFSGSGFQNKPPQKVEQPKQLKLAKMKKDLDQMRQDGTKFLKPKVFYDKLNEYEKLKHDLKD